MNVKRMRFVDAWLGIPVCLTLTLWRWIFARSSKSCGRPSKILFIKLSEQGSTVLAQEAIQTAAERVGRRNVYFLLFAENWPILDILDLVPATNVIVIDTKGLVGTVLGACRAVFRLRRTKIDTAVDLEFFARSSAALAYLSGASHRVGYHAYKGAGPYRGDLMTHRLSFNPYLHTSQTFRMMVDALDHPPNRFPAYDFQPPAPAATAKRFTPDPDELHVVRALVREESRCQHDPKLILLNANASDLLPLRKWPSDRYVELARRLLERYPDILVSFTGSTAERSPIEKLVHEVQSDRCISLAGKTSLRQLLTLYSLAEVLVTNDSGPAHFASLCPIDVVVLFGPETPRLFAACSSRTHPMSAQLACSPCINAFNNRNSACRDNVCMQRITVDQVFNRVCDVYEARLRSETAATPHTGWRAVRPTITHSVMTT
jgi:ADP-heptose:LPS heptosyltransferase